ncbi:hypothetical protein K788_0005449 [Paraburkholderia caribensis MBA4]|uniref:Uncharacterized protein n=1 Tax=Paraburkholderia caribensis MBA4 TaxID=1323664 RepID=A0A0P0RGE6_9BURK|nr:hypothetical protein K788_0005449 [Paraburkholderia caribensis MBA4]
MTCDSVDESRPLIQRIQDGIEYISRSNFPSRYAYESSVYQ